MFRIYKPVNLDSPYKEGDYVLLGPLSDGSSVDVPFNVPLSDGMRCPGPFPFFLSSVSLPNLLYLSLIFTPLRGVLLFSYLKGIGNCTFYRDSWKSLLFFSTFFRVKLHPFQYPLTLLISSFFLGYNLKELTRRLLKEIPLRIF